MRAQRNNGDIDLGVVNLVNHPVLLVDAPAPGLLEDKMFQVLHLASAGAGMLLKLYHHPVGGR